MPRLKLTGRNVATLPAQPGRATTDYRDALLPGLVLRVSAGGRRTWAVEHHETHEGRRRGARLKLGRFPRMTLADARELAREVLGRIRAGESPRAAAAMDVSGLVAKMLAARQLAASTRKEWERLLAVEIAGAVGTRPAAELTRAEVRALHRAIAARSGYIANRTVALLRRAYSWAVSEDLLQASPCDHLPLLFEETSSERVLSTPEVAGLVRALRTFKGGYADATWLLLLTGVRRGEVLGARREEFQDLASDQALWIVPGARTKNGRPHLVPLSRAAAAVAQRRFQAVCTAHLFPALRRTDPAADEAASWPTRWVNKLKAAVALEVRVPGALAMPPDERARALEEAPERPVPPWKIHGLRHTLATHLREDLGVRLDVVEQLLGHTGRGAAATRIYDRAEMLPERRAALVAWAAWLDRVSPIEEVVGGDVLPFAR